MEQTDPLIGRSIGGKYELLSLLGKGGMGTVYKAEQTFIGRTVALKLLRPKEYESNIDEYLQRFRREAQTASQIRHPSAITIYDYGVETVEGAEDLPYLAMEFIEGKTLKEVLKETGTLPLDRIIPIMAQVCGALHEAHLLGIVHRDLKPDNIMISKRHDGSEWAHVLDFGIAKVLTEGGEGEEAGMTMTRTGSVIGTPRYMSPEQVLSRSVDQKTDIYSLGIILYELICGKAPFDAASFMEVAMQHINEPPKPLKEQESAKNVSDAVAKVVMKALEKDPANRPKTAKEFSDSLISASNLDFSSISTDSFSLGGLSSSGIKIGSKKKKLVVGGAVLTALGLLGGAFFLSGGSDSGSDEEKRKALMSELNSGGEQVPPGETPTQPEKSAEELEREAEEQRLAKKREEEAQARRRREAEKRRAAREAEEKLAEQRRKELAEAEQRIKEEQERLAAERERLRIQRVEQQEREAAAAKAAEDSRLERIKAEAEAERIRIEQEEAKLKLEEEAARLEREKLQSAAAEEERRRLAAEAERKRVEAEQQRQAEEAERKLKEQKAAIARKEEAARKAREAAKQQQGPSAEELERRRQAAIAKKRAEQKRAAEAREAARKAKAEAERARIEKARKAREEAAKRVEPTPAPEKKRRRLCGPPFARRFCED